MSVLNNIRSALLLATRRFDRDSPLAGVARSSIYAFATQLVGLVLAFAAQLVLARSLSEDGFGVYAYVFAWVTVLTYLAKLGFETTVLRFIPIYEVRKEWPLLVGTISFAERSILAVGVGVVLLGWAVTFLYADKISESLFYTFLIGLPIIPIWAFVWLRGSIVRAFGGVVSAIAPDRVFREFTVAAGVGLLWLVGYAVSPMLAMAITLLGTGLGFLFVSWAKIRFRPQSTIGVKAEYLPASWTIATAPLLAITLLDVLLGRTGIFMVGAMVSTAEAGVFALISQISVLTLFLQNAIALVFSPKIARYHETGERAELQKLVTATSSWSFLGALAISLPIVLFASFWLSLFGPHFVKGAVALCILHAGYVVASSCGPVVDLLTMTGRGVYAAYFIAAGNIVNVALCVALVPSIGLEGAAIAMATAYAAMNFAFSIYMWRQSGIVPGIAGFLLARPEPR